MFVRKCYPLRLVSHVSCYNQPLISSSFITFDQKQITAQLYAKTADVILTYLNRKDLALILSLYMDSSTPGRRTRGHFFQNQNQQEFQKMVVISFVNL